MVGGPQSKQRSSARVGCWCVTISLVASGFALTEALSARFLPRVPLQILSLLIVLAAFVASFLGRRALLSCGHGKCAFIKLAIVLCGAASVLACLVARHG